MSPEELNTALGDNRMTWSMPETLYNMKIRAADVGREAAIVYRNHLETG